MLNSKSDRLKSYVYVDGIKIVHRIHARDEAHAASKLEAIHGIVNPDGRLVTHADYIIERDLVREQMGG